MEAARLQHAHQHRPWDKRWQSEVISKETKFDGPDGYQCYVPCCGPPEEAFPTCVRGVATVWWHKCIRQTFLAGVRQLHEHCRLHEIPQLKDEGQSLFGGQWGFQRDQATIHVLQRPSSTSGHEPKIATFQAWVQGMFPPSGIRGDKGTSSPPRSDIFKPAQYTCLERTVLGVCDFYRVT